jgi:hypothetical protein
VLIAMMTLYLFGDYRIFGGATEAGVKPPLSLFETCNACTKKTLDYAFILAFSLIIEYSGFAFACGCKSNF